MFEKNEFESLMLDSPEVPMTDEEVVKMAEDYGYSLDPGSEFD